MINPAFRARAEAVLAAVEREEGVRILLAIESGGRAWGFPSRDSDYDVRFIFIRPLADDLRVSPLPDVIERPIDDALDLGGWDVSKALGLMLRSNAVIGVLLARKALATEADTVPRQPVLDRFLAEKLADVVPRPPVWDQEPRQLAADKLFQDLVLGRDKQGRSDAPRP